MIFSPNHMKKYFTMTSRLFSAGHSLSARSAMFLCLSLALLCLLQQTAPASACNEAVCASIVSKCTLLRSCECKITPGEACTCCDRCKKCLDFLLTECCSCFGLCPKPNLTSLAQDSVVFDLDAVPELWQAFTAGEDERWDKYTYPVDIHPASVQQRTLNLNEVDTQPAGQAVLDKSLDLVTVNCTVVYLPQCMPKDKCKDNCGTLGASQGRWFEDGCCECVGHHCLNYGINESRCTECASHDDDEEIDLDELSDEELEQLEKKLAEETAAEED